MIVPSDISVKVVKKVSIEVPRLPITITRMVEFDGELITMSEPKMKINKDFHDEDTETKLAEGRNILAYASVQTANELKNLYRMLKEDRTVTIIEEI